jgi:hypothetical protein
MLSLIVRAAPHRNRFRRKIKLDPATGCYLWQGSTDNHGYGQLSVGGRKGRPRKAHRITWELARGPIPAGMNVLHTCDTPACVRIGHLFLGTQADNVADMDKKGRRRTPNRRGENNSRTILTTTQAHKIRSHPSAEGTG